MDKVDRKIIARLRADGRESYATIGADVGLSTSAVKRRVDKLMTLGVIRSFTIDVDPAAEGNATQAFVEVHCRGTVSPSELRRVFSEIPEIRYACTVTGSTDAVVFLSAPDLTALEEALERIRRVNVDHTRSMVVLSTLVRSGL